MERNEKRRIVEALILASPEPATAGRLAGVVPGATAAEVKALVSELNEEYAAQGRAFEIWEVGGGYQLRTRAELASYVRQLDPARRVRLSPASLETLAIVAYKQPVTRAEVEHVRGVDVGAVLRSLLERRLVRIAGHRDVPGRPILYGTTRRFLEVFGLKSLEDLPALRDLEELARAAGALAEEGEEPGSEATGESDEIAGHGEPDGIAGDDDGEPAAPGDDVPAEAGPSSELH